MHEQDKAILKSLVERGLGGRSRGVGGERGLEALLQAFEATPAEADEIREYADPAHAR